MDTKKMLESKDFDAVNFIMDYEGGAMNSEDMVSGFAALVRNGTVWQLQGNYGRTASHLIEIGVLDREGNVDYDVLAELLTDLED
jgi:hypothetical protein